MEEVKNPCRKDCPRRSATCHSTCQEYEKFRQWKLWTYDQHLKESKENNAFFESSYKIHLRSVRYRKGKKI